MVQCPAVSSHQKMGAKLWSWQDGQDQQPHLGMLRRVYDAKEISTTTPPAPAWPVWYQQPSHLNPFLSTLGSWFELHL